MTSNENQTCNTPSNIALAAAVTGLERELAQRGWDQEPRLFVLLRTRDLLAETPNLPQEMQEQLGSLVEQLPDHLTPVLQDDLPPAPMSELLGHLVFPPEVTGVAVALERIVLPPEAEAEAPQEEPAKTEFFMKHASRDDVRMVVGVVREGDSWCALRVRSNDEDSMVATGADLVPELIEALSGTLDEVAESELINPADIFGEA